MVKVVHDNSGVSIFELYKPFRNRVHCLSRDDALYVLWAYVQKLQFREFSIPNDIQAAVDFSKRNSTRKWFNEWDIELLVKEIILHAGNLLSARETLRNWNNFASLLNSLKTFEDRVSELYSSTSNVMIELHRIAHRQFIWQSNSPNAVSLIRYLKIFNDDDIVDLCVQQTGLTVSDLYRCGVAFIGHYFSQPFIKLPINSSIPNLPSSSFALFLEFMCRNIKTLRKMLEQEQRYDSAFSYSYSSLRAYPLIDMSFRGIHCIVCPMPTLLFWRMTGGLYYNLVGKGGFSQALGKSFQRYVGDVLKQAFLSGANIHAEHRYGETKANKKDSVDWIVDEGSHALFLECKSKRISWDAKTALDNIDPIRDDLEVLAVAIVQLYKTILDYFNGKYENFPFSSARTVYPIIVTLEDWQFFGGEIQGMLHSKVMELLDKNCLSLSILNEMPYSIWSASDLEVCTQGCDAYGIGPFMDGMLHDDEFKHWLWPSYIKHKFPAMKRRNLFKNEYDKFFANLELPIG